MNEYKVEELKVSDLDIDRRVQRQSLNMAKIEKIVKRFNPHALGVIHVSRRKDRSNIVLDGQHRVEAVRRVTDAVGFVTCHVYEGLTLQEEATLFLQLNTTTRPRILDQFLVEVTSGDQAAQEIVKQVGEYAWAVSHSPNNGNINAVAALRKIHALSERLESDPPLLSLTILTITRAWGSSRYGVQAAVMEGIAAFHAEYGSLIDQDHLVNVLKNWRLGPQGLHDDAQLHSVTLQKMRVPMALASVLVHGYNKGRRSKLLSPWNKR